MTNKNREKTRSLKNFSYEAMTTTMLMQDTTMKTQHISSMYTPWSFSDNQSASTAGYPGAGAYPGHPHNQGPAEFHPAGPLGSAGPTTPTRGDLPHPFWPSPVGRPRPDWESAVDPLSRSTNSDKFGLGSSTGSGGE